MANVFVNLPAPAGSGVGAGVDTSTMGRDRTITVENAFRGVVTIEFSNVGTGGPWAQIASFQIPSKRTIPMTGAAMRVRRSGVPLVGAGFPVVKVGSNDNGGLYADLPAPAGDGVGASVDTSTFGTFNTVTCLGTFNGTTIIEISEDGVEWSQCLTFTNPDFQAKVFAAQFMRVRRAGVPLVAPGLPDVDVGAINDSVSNAASSTIVSPPEKWTQQDVAASQTDVDLFGLVSVNFDTIKAIRAGSIVGLSTRFTAAITDATASSAVVSVTVNGAAGTLALSHSSGTNPSGGEVTQAAGIDTFVAGDLLGIQITTLGTFAPTTTEIEAWMEIS